jgi:uncharacterized repeat protein (TIGR03803 family)
MNIALYAMLIGIAPQARAAYAVLHSHEVRSALPQGRLVADGTGWLYGSTMCGGDANRGTIYRVREDGTGFATLHSFDDGAACGIVTPVSLILDGAGSLYGTRSPWAAANRGTVFTLKKDGTAFRVLHEFLGGPDDGADPEAALLLDGAGNLYGTTVFGGAADLGTVFKLRADGAKFGVLRSFSLNGNGLSPRAPLILDRAQNLYGTTSGYNYANLETPGTVFTMKTNGNGFRVLHAFRNEPSDGSNPVAPLVLGDGDILYGTTSEGGPTNSGTLFRLRIDGSGYTMLYTFSGTPADGNLPETGLVLDNSGDLFGTLTYAGVFKLHNDGSGFVLLHSFGLDPQDGFFPESQLFLDTNGRLYGTTTEGGAAGIGTLYSINTDGTGYERFYSFKFQDVRNPFAALTSDPEGNLYGAASLGGAFGKGAVFTVRSDGTGYRLLYSFEGAPSGDGSGALLIDDSGTLYGASGGGASNQGLLFSLRRDGTGFTILHTFAGGRDDGAGPSGVLARDASGRLYGTTSGGVTGGVSTVYSLNPDGSGFRVLHVFGDAPQDGTIPTAGVVLDGSGIVYGTTSAPVTIFRITPDGKYSVLHRFDFGYLPNSAGLVLDGQGHLFGTTFLGGNLSNAGMVFRLNNDGTGYRVLHSFTGAYSTDAANPIDSLVLDKSGTLYGTATGGGVFRRGAVFKLKTDGNDYSLLHEFAGGAIDGEWPWASLLLDGAGYLYGTTYYGGSFNEGIEFRLAANPGDGNGDGVVNVSDIFYLINALYASGPAPFAGGDANGDGVVDVADVFYLLNYLFARGPAPHN